MPPGERRRPGSYPRAGLRPRLQVVGGREVRNLSMSGAAADHGVQKDRQGVLLKSDNIFNSPIVLYSWAPVTDALVASSVAAKSGGATRSTSPNSSPSSTKGGPGATRACPN